ncbi:3975_t:CDS:2 [Acaulospora morrowiae]|uniref:Clathrin light chain n=1 Tax=Acaulospora morrowiae TaxID=94023 RepID=A0A9N9HTD3_9GLOM|nr:3975_t:CDS:2 [Acaulospora morrowiae]
MEDLNFEISSVVPSTDPTSDPTTDFLAREQAVLGDDAALFSTPSDPIEISSFPDISSSANDLFVPPTSSVTLNNTLPDYSVIHSEFPSVEIENTQISYSGTNGLLTSNGHPIYQNFEEEPEAIRQWKERQREIISRRDQESESKRKETILIAQEAIDKFYEEYNEKKARAHNANKQEEETFLQERDDLTSGTAWERICKQVDLSNAQSKSNVRHVKDVSRFRELLLSLKKDENSPGAGGY